MTEATLTAEPASLPGRTVSAAPAPAAAAAAVSPAPTVYALTTFFAGATRVSTGDAYRADHALVIQAPQHFSTPPALVPTEVPPDVPAEVPAEPEQVPAEPVATRRRGRRAVALAPAPEPSAVDG